MFSVADVCKRILAVEGERVVTTKGRGFFQEVVRTTVPSGHVWLAGDNVDNSTDSRNYGPVPIGLLQGRVFVKLGPTFIPPFTRIGREIPSVGQKQSKPTVSANASNSNNSNSKSQKVSGDDKAAEGSPVVSVNKESVLVPRTDPQEPQIKPVRGPEADLEPSSKKSSSSTKSLKPTEIVKNSPEAAVSPNPLPFSNDDKDRSA